MAEQNLKKVVYCTFLHKASAPLLTSQTSREWSAVPQPSTAPAIGAVKRGAALVGEYNSAEIYLHILLGPRHALFLVPLRYFRLFGRFDIPGYHIENLVSSRSAHHSHSSNFKNSLAGR